MMESAPERGDGALKLILALLMGTAGLLTTGAGAAWFLSSRVRGCRATPESYAVGSLRTITTAQSIFQESDRNRDGISDYGDLTDLGSANLVDTVLSAGTKQGYRFTVVRGTDGFTSSGYLWWAAADPINPDDTGYRYFFTNQSGVIYFSNTDPIRPIPGSTINEPANGAAIGGQ